MHAGTHTCILLYARSELIAVFATATLVLQNHWHRCFTFFQRDWFNCQVTWLLPDWGGATWTACKGKGFTYFLLSCLELAQVWPFCLAVWRAEFFSTGEKRNCHVSWKWTRQSLRLLWNKPLCCWENNTDGLNWGFWLSFTTESHCDTEPWWRAVCRKWRDSFSPVLQFLSPQHMLSICNGKAGVMVPRQGGVNAWGKVVGKRICIVFEK